MQNLNSKNIHIAQIFSEKRQKKTYKHKSRIPLINKKTRQTLPIFHIKLNTIDSKNIFNLHINFDSQKDKMIIIQIGFCLFLLTGCISPQL